MTCDEKAAAPSGASSRADSSSSTRLEGCRRLIRGRSNPRMRRRGKATQRVMDPLSFMARLAALVPPPRRAVLRYYGVFGPHSDWRSSVGPERALMQDVKDATESSESAQKHDCDGATERDKTPTVQPIVRHAGQLRCLGIPFSIKLRSRGPSLASTSPCMSCRSWRGSRPTD